MQGLLQCSWQHGGHRTEKYVYCNIVFFYYGENLEIHGYFQCDFSEQDISVTEKKILDNGLYDVKIHLDIFYRLEIHLSVILNNSLSTIIHQIYKKKNLNFIKNNPYYLIC